METIARVIAVVLVFTIFGGVVWGFLWLFSHAPKCVQWADEYYWEHWDGTRRYVGGDLEKATQMAAGKPISKETRCVEFSSNQ